jgi:redox-sensitive bicupin YhaK (pirin superfamily)
MTEVKTAMKKILGTYGPGSEHWVGDGFPVRNLFPSNGVNQEVNPFLMLDYAGPSHFHPTKQKHGVGQHPHRGFETVTIAYQGSVEHRDSAGNAGVIRPGDVQWMTAASGVVHEEFHGREFAAEGGTFEMVQLWVNLPRAVKMAPPRYQGITKKEIPTVVLGGRSTARVIAGELLGVKGAARTFSPINLFDIQLKAGDTVQLPIPEGHHAALVLRKGDVRLNGAETLKGEVRISVLGVEGDEIRLEALEDSTLLVLSGEPINEPVASYGPFVMNTKEELVQAFKDYESGKMGHLS